MRLILFQDPLMVTLNQAITTFNAIARPAIPHLNAVIISTLFLWIVGMIWHWCVIKATQPDPNPLSSATRFRLLLAMSVMIGLLSGDGLLRS